MNDDVSDLRQGDRYLVADAVEGTFGATTVALINVSLRGAQLAHAHPLRIGTPAALIFHHGEARASVEATVVWSHLEQTEGGLRYKSGIKIDAPDVGYAAALNTLIRTGAIALDIESLERKRQREADREQRRKSGPRFTNIPSAGT